MNVLYPVRVNNFFCLVEKLCWLAGVKNTKHFHSKKMYGNIKLSFLVVYKEKLNVSYRRFVEICEENSIAHMLGLKRIPHFTTLQKFVQRTPKALFEQLVKVCGKLLNLKHIESSIDGTGFSNNNPSHYYLKRCRQQKRPVKVKNYTKTLFITDNKSKLVLNVKTFSHNVVETIQLKPMVSEIADYLSTIVADKGYDSQSNRKHCREKGIQPHIPLREYEQTRSQTTHVSKRTIEQRLFNKLLYNRRALIESVNSAIKRTLGSYTNNKTASNQQKQTTIKAIAYNIEHIGRTIKIKLFINYQ